MKGTLIPGAITSGAYWFQGKVSAGLAQDRITKVVLHSTETPPPNCPGYGGGVSAPTLTIDPWNLVMWQHFPANVSAKALVDPTSTTVRENRDEVAQIEILGYTYPPSGREQYALSLIPDRGLALIARVLRWYADEGWGLPLRTTVPWSPYNSVRLNGPEYDAYTGVLGHMHVSGNDHTDPGGLNIGRILTLATGQGATTEGDDMPTLQELQRDIERRGPDGGWSVGDAIAARVAAEVSHALSVSGTAGAADTRVNGVGQVLALIGALPQQLVDALADDIKIDPSAIAAAIPDELAEDVVDALAARLAKAAS